MTPKELAEKYELVELVENSGEFYRVRKAYGAGIAKSLYAAMVQASQPDVAVEFGLPNIDPFYITNQDAGQWINANLYEADFENGTEKSEELKDAKGDVILDENGKPKITIRTIPAAKIRDPMPENLSKAIFKTLCTPIGAASSVLSIYDDISDEAYAKVISFFLLCYSKQPATSKKSDESLTDSTKSGEQTLTSSHNEENTTTS